MIEFQDVLLGFDRHRVLDRINFTAHYYDKIAIIVGSGEGKTTILKLLLGLTHPDSGRILIDGQDITDLPETGLRDARMNFSIVFQDGALFDSMDVRENVAFNLREQGGLSEEKIEKIVREILSKLGIEEAIDLMPEELSGGMQRRVAIARSLASNNPKMMLYDEPTTGLDPITADNICALMSELSSGVPPDRKGLIMVTHDVDAAAKTAERFMYLNHGKIEFDGSLAALKSNDNPGLKKFIMEILI